MSYIGSCHVFPAYTGASGDKSTDDLSAWNQEIAHAPLDPMSDTYMRRVDQGQKVAVRCRYGNAVQIFPVPANQPMVPIKLDKPEHYISPRSIYEAPMPVHPENLEDGDHHMLVVQRDQCKLYELWTATENADGTWSCGASIAWDLSDPRPAAHGTTSADAAGLPMAPGLMRYGEVASGAVRHAIRTSFSATQSAYVLPACHYAGQRDTSLPPMGARLRLRRDWYSAHLADFPLGSQARTVVRALRRYGLIVADNGGFTINGAGDPRWAGDQDAYMELYARLTGQQVGRFGPYPGVPLAAFEFVAHKAPLQS